MDGKEPDVDNRFLIVARGIESMSVNPTESQIQLINKIAAMIAIEQTIDSKASKYPGVWYVKQTNNYQGSFQYLKKVYKAFGQTDKICFDRLTILKHKIKGNGK